MKDKNSFYSMWSIAIVLCTALCIFLLFHSCLSKPKDSGQSETPTQIQEQAEY